MTPTAAIADKIRATGKPINAIANNAGVPPTLRLFVTDISFGKDGAGAVLDT